MNTPTQQLDSLSLGDLAQMAVDIREEKKALEAQATELGKRLDQVKRVIFNQLTDLGVDRTAVSGITVSRSITDMPNVVDWDAVEGFVRSNDLLSLYQRRLSSALWREMLEAGTVVPGVEVYKKEDVNIRKG